MFTARKSDMVYVKSTVVSGDAMKHDDYDLIAQTVDLPVEMEPLGDGWRIMTGNSHTNHWARVAYRNEC